MTKRAAIYARISRDEEDDGLGVARQEGDCRQLVERNHWQLVDVHVDNSVSAYKVGRRRPAYARLLEQLKDGDVDVVVVWHPDRLHRSPRELEDFIDLLDATGATVATVTAGDFDLATPDGRLVARIVGSVARKESEDKSRRIRRKHLELAERGAVSSGRRAYGYAYDPETKQRSIIPREAEVIRAAAADVLAGVSLNAVCRDLNERCIPRATGPGVWHSTILRGILMSARIAGQRERFGQVVADGAWEPIITPAESARLRALLSDPTRRSASPPRRYLLSGLVRCARCGTVMVSRGKANGKRGYACQSGTPWFGCGRMFIQAEPLEAIIAAAVLEVVDSPAVHAEVGRVQTIDVDGARGEIAASEAELEQLAELHGSRVISLAEWMAARKPVEARLVAARAQLGQVSGRGAVARLLRPGPELASRWATLDLDRQRALVAALIEYVPVNAHDRAKGRDFQSDRIGDPVWRA